MLQFNHNLKNFWQALGLPEKMAKTLIEKISEFTALYMTEDKFRKSFSATPKSYQTKFILKDVFLLTETDMKDPAVMFLAGHLLGAFDLLQRNEKENTVDKMTQMKNDIVKKMDQDFEDF